MHRRAAQVRVVLEIIIALALPRQPPQRLNGIKPNGRVLVVAPGRDEKLELSARNLPTVEVILADSLNVVDLLKADVVLIEQPALARMEEVYA